MTLTDERRAILAIILLALGFWLWVSTIPTTQQRERDGVPFPRFSRAEIA